MSDFPDVILSTPYIAQTEYKSEIVDILQISDDVIGKNLRAFCQLGPSKNYQYWVPVMSGPSYNVNWTNDDVVAAVQAYFVNP